MHFFIIIAAALIFMPDTINASPAIVELKSKGQACYGREYSDQEMSLNPGQIAKAIRVYLLTDQNSDSIYMYVNLTLRKEMRDHKTQKTFSGYIDYQTDMYCHTVSKDQGKIFCSVFCDGGSVVLALNTRSNKKTEGIKLINEGFAINGTCGSMNASLSQHGPEIFQSTLGNQSFTLFPLPTKFCAL